MTFCTKEDREFVVNHGRQTEGGGWICKETGAPIQCITVQQVAGTPAFEPGDRGTYAVDVMRMWCDKCTPADKIPAAKNFDGKRVSERDLIKLY